MVPSAVVQINYTGHPKNNSRDNNININNNDDNNNKIIIMS